MPWRRIPIQLSGGQNDAFDGSEILPNELQIAQNIDYATHLRGGTRLGLEKFNTTRYVSSGVPLRILGLTHFAKGIGDYVDVMVGLPSGGAEQLYTVVGNTATQVTWDSNISAGTNGYPYDFAVIRNKLFGTNGDTEPWMYTGTGNAHRVGIEAPGSAPTPATNGAGNLYGDYIWAVVFRDGTEGVLGEAVTTSSLSCTNEAAQLTSVPTSTNPRVTQRYIYRTFGSGSPPYYYVGVIDDNVTTTFDDDVGDAGLGSQLVEGGQPPKCRFMLVMQGRMYYLCQPSGENYVAVYYSNVLRPEEVQSGSYILVESGEGDPIMGAVALWNQIILFKQTAVMHLSPYPHQLQTISTDRGLNWAHAMAQIEQSVIFSDRVRPYAYDLSEFAALANQQKICPAQGSYSDAIANNPDGTVAANFGREVRALHDPDRRQILLSYSSESGMDYNDRTLAYNYGTPEQPWAEYTYGFDVSGVWRNNFSGKKTVVVGLRDADGFVFEPNSGYVDRHDGTGTLAGTATDGSATTIEDGGASFSTTGDGLMDCYVYILDATDGTTSQVAKVVSNTGTIITVSSWPSFTPAAGDTYAIGSIETKWRSPRLGMEDPTNDKQPKRMYCRVKDIGSAEPTVIEDGTVNLYLEDDTSPTETTTIDLSDDDTIAGLNSEIAAGKDVSLELVFRSVNGGKQFTAFLVAVQVTGERED